MTNQAQNQKPETKPSTCRSPIRSFGHSNLIRHSGFGFRISSGFTLVELLVVIGIILILIGILLPAVSKLRMSAYATDTSNEISQISNACGQYYSTFHAYPGPFSNDDTTGGPTSNLAVGFGTGSGTPTLQDIYFNSAVNPLSSDAAFTKSPWTVTGAENLVLGLMGGLRLVSSNPTVLAFAPTEVGLGPLSLNPVNPARTPSFFSTGSNYLMWCQLNGANQNIQTPGAYQPAVTTGTPPSQTPVFTGTAFTDPAGSAAYDCPIPVFVDRFAAPGPLPILYLRARTGAKGIVWDNISVQQDGNGNAPADYQYDTREIYPYTFSHIGLPSTDSTGQPNSHNLTNIGAFPPNPVLPNMSPVVYTNATAPHPQQTANAGPYFMNTSITATNSSTDIETNFTGRPRMVDQFILISAGPDGVYGTADDITSFGSVSN
jgi:prepilin-type N-terminal cleavage/methylation domain-containing protein